MNEKINYIEFASCDLAATRAFFEQAFGWTFEAYGEDYLAFSSSGLDGGCFRAERVSTAAEAGAPLVVLFGEDLDDVLARVERSGGAIVRAPFAFPGGRRFHFREPGGNELAVWSDRD
ncbi:MAG: VOC family protein [Pseudomonadota bacterium]